MKIAVTEDGVYRVTGRSLADALPPNTSLDDIAPGTLRLLENGSEIPIHVEGGGDGSFDADDAIHFVGQRNRGDDELWAYQEPSDQSSPYYSLYTDTTYYWLTWGGSDGRRYRSPSSPATTPTTSLRDTIHLEQDNTYYFGRSFESGNSFYTRSEGYYWREFALTSTGRTSATYTLPTARRTATDDSLRLAVRLGTKSNSCHRVRLSAELQQSGGGTAFEPLTTVEWRGYERQTLRAAVVQNRVPGDLRIRITSFNETFSDPNCPPPSDTPNFVLLDYIEADYIRRLAATNGTQQFEAPAAQDYTFSLSGYSSGSVQVYNPSDARRFVVSTSGGVATVSDAPSALNTSYRAVGPSALKAPAAVQPDASSNWSVASQQGADYVILTTEALLPSARALADYRRTERGYDVAVVTIQNVFDEFDYGRPTPIAVRRFARATQSWSPAPEFLTIFADAAYPVDPGPSDPRPSWSVPSFGYAPSDGWYAMQAEGPNDWSEFLAVGRVPVRTNAQGNLFVDKLRTYENTEPAVWQKRMLLLAGGTDESEQRALQFYSNEWGKLATGTADSLYAAGMDTLRYYKEVNDALDTSFQDSLSVDLRRGAGWLSYFGHSAAQTWEIVTDPPKNWGNTGRLPVILSLGCKTGSFAGDRFGTRATPSLGERFVVGSVSSNGDPVSGARNGGIAHWGTSALGNRLPSARLGDALTTRVFTDTMRVLGTAIQRAKARIARDFGQSSVYQRHLLTYGLLGDPATRIAIADKPELSIRREDIRTRPDRPTPAEPLSVDVTIQNLGLVPSDSVGLNFQWRRPDGSQVQRSRRVPRFALSDTSSFRFTPTRQAVGESTFRATADPADAYNEVDETNNTASRDQIIFGTGLTLISPSGDGVTTTRSPRLRLNLLRQETSTARIEIQVDSLPSFDSPARQSATLESDDAVVDWTPPRPLTEGRSYYWRARLASDQQSWETSRFTVRADTSTLDWFQQGRLFRENTQSRIRREDGSWTYRTFNIDVQAKSERGGLPYGPYGFTINGVRNHLYLNLGFGVLVMDGTTGRVKAAESFITYNVQDRFIGERDDNGEMGEAADSLASFLDRTVTTGDYVFVRTRHLGRESGSSVEISDRVKSLFRNLGSTDAPEAPYTQAIDTLNYNKLWTLKARKGHPSATVEKASPPPPASQGLALETTLPFPYPSGTTTTPVIGPAQQWDRLVWSAPSPPPGSEVRIDVLSADRSTVLIDDLTDSSRSLSAIDPTQHPRIRLRATLTDSTRRVPPQFASWGVSFTPVPELSVVPSALAQLPDTVSAGEPVEGALPVRHLSGPAADGVRGTSTLTGPSNQTRPLATDTLGTIAPNATDTLAFSAQSNRSGQNLLQLSVEGGSGPEPVAYNNTAQHSFYVTADQTPPSLTVLSEGRELPPVSSSLQSVEDLPFVPTDPRLRVQVRDNNPFLRLADTSYVKVFFKEGPPSGAAIGSPYRRVAFSSPALSFTPPDEEGENQARVLYEPDLPPRDTTYSLRVEARDAQGNEVDPYVVSFQVQQEQVIEDLYPYPNPMSEHTQFAFRIRGGGSRPEDFTLRIYTLSGRLVREFDGSAVNGGRGLRATGWNVLRWNGRDEDGDRVATGVYLYRVRMEGENGTFEGDVEKIAVIR